MISKKHEGRNSLEDLGVDGKIILKRICQRIGREGEGWGQIAEYREQ
jgi:hypothetical protein